MILLFALPLMSCVSFEHGVVGYMESASPVLEYPEGRPDTVKSESCGFEIAPLGKLATGLFSKTEGKPVKDFEWSATTCLSLSGVVVK